MNETKLLPVRADERIYKYVLKERIGQGNFGSVWLARDDSIAREVALKIIPEEKTPKIDLLDEARIGNHLDHDNLVKIHYADKLIYKGKNIVIIVMKYYRRGSVLSELKSEKYLPIQKAILTVVDVLKGLEYLHNEHLFHNDIKPSNILVREDGQSVLTDYGITCYSPNGESVLSKYAYQLHKAPEVICTHRIDVRSDIYQVGLTLFRLVNNIDHLSNICNDIVIDDDYFDLVARGRIINTDDYQHFVPTRLRTIINKSINVKPDRRYQKAVDMRRDLEKLNYSGRWVKKPSGGFTGYDKDYEYRFEEEELCKRIWNFTAFKKKIIKGRETRIGKFSKKKISFKEKNKVKCDFMQSVVSGLK